MEIACQYKLSATPKCLQHRGLTLTRAARNLSHARTNLSNSLGELMELRDFFSEDAIKLELEGTTKDDILKELIGLLGLDDKSEGMLFKMLKRRENLGSTGIGRGIAIPHCRSGGRRPAARRPQCK